MLSMRAGKAKRARHKRFGGHVASLLCPPYNALTAKPSKSALFDAAKRWDAAAATALLKAAPDLVRATDPKGGTGLHIACAAKPGPSLGEPHGLKTVTALLAAGAELEAH